MKQNKHNQKNYHTRTNSSLRTYYRVPSGFHAIDPKFRMDILSIQYSTDKTNIKGKQFNSEKHLFDTSHILPADIEEV